MQVFWGVRNIPRFDKKRDGGDDGWFSNDEDNAGGVSDGVGSWRKKGVKAGTFARSMMAKANNRIEQGMNPYDALQSAFVDWEDKSSYGSATFCVAQLIDDVLYVAQLGDTCILVQRNGRVVYQSNEQEHLFNVPFQLGSGNESFEDFWRYQISLLPGDTIIIASDGLFNNLYRSKILSIINSYPVESKNPNSISQNIADQLANEAYDQSMSNKYWSPFAQRSYEMGITEAFDVTQLGGKPDDITVLVGRVLSEDERRD